ncbi:MAG: diguanylate cyclase [Thermodesulfovibrionales bacterium]|nr:diguanylate cyclase [Thermodesulfovibrionales bacterium]
MNFPRRCGISLIEKLFTEKIIFPFLDYLKDPIVIIKRDGKIVEANAAFSELAGMSKERIVGKRYGDLKPLNVLHNAITRCIAKNAEQSEQIILEGQYLSAAVMPVMVEDELARMSIIYRDITGFMQIEKELLRRNKELMVINTLSHAFISSGNIDLVYDDLLEKALLISDFGAGWLVIVEEDEYAVKTSRGVSIDFKNKLKDRRFDGLYDRILGSNDPLCVLEQPELPDDIRSEGMAIFSGIPLRVGSEAVGVLAFASRAEVVFDFDIASLLSLIGNNFSFIAEKITLFKETQRLAITDGLTDIYNARYFYSSLEAEIARTKRYSTPFSLVLFDIDNFKFFNDTYGHQAGDDVLRSVAGLLKKASRKSDVVTRYGGEEFIAILPNTSKIEAFGLAVRIKEAVENEGFLGDESIRVTLSGGVATCPDDAEDSKSLLYAADMAMYEAKAAGKKKIFCYKGNK